METIIFLQNEVILKYFRGPIIVKFSDLSGNNLHA
jgi:hypothetical protein